MKIYYGKTNRVDVSNILESKTLPIFFPASDDLRWKIFGLDPESGVVKNIYIIDDYNDEYVFDNTVNFSIQKDSNNKLSIINHTEKLKNIQNQLTIQHGTLSEEYDEQVMASIFIKPTMRVLEIGGNIGRNSCVISKLLADSSQLTVVESDPISVNKLYDNKKHNKLNFNIIDGAISNKQMIQHSWDTKYSDEVPIGWKRINTIRWENVLYRHGPFECLVADCEGALYYLNEEDPTFFSNFKLILVENDYHTIEHKEIVDKSLIKQGFQVVYEKGGGWGCCKDFFYQVWKKIN